MGSQTLKCLLKLTSSKKSEKNEPIPDEKTNGQSVIHRTFRQSRSSNNIDSDSRKEVLKIISRFRHFVVMGKLKN